jgi:hypothetical protein
MRALFAGLLAGTLVGCTSVPNPERGVAQKPVASKVSGKTAKQITKKVKATAKSEPAKSESAKSESTGTTIAALPKSPDPVTEKAKAAVAAMLEDPASAEFYDLKRANKKLPHRTVDTVCGYVKATVGSGEEPRGMPFLFTVDDGEAYLVSGTSRLAETVYNHLCR